MGLRFRRSVKICKGVKVNFGKTGASLTVGTRGFHHTVHTSGKRTTSVGILGTGLSYVSTSGGGRRKSSKRRTSSSNARAQQQAYAQQQKQIEYANNCEMVDDYNELMDQIRSIHDECSDPIDWNAMRDKEPPFNYLYKGPNEIEARNAFENAKPSLISRLVPALNQKKMKTLEDAIEIARQKDQQMYADWEEMKNLAEAVLQGDIDSYFYVVSELKPFEEILDFGSDFDIGTDLPNIMEVEFHAKTEKVVPNHVLSMTQTGRLSSKAMTKTMHYDIAQDYICSCALRVAREMFALLPINTVVIHAVDTVENTSGETYDDTVLSVLIHRDQIASIDFSNIDASDTIESFQCNMNFKKTQGLKPVPRVDF